MQEPGVDGQDFADIEAYGVQRWLGELALALRQETYRPAHRTVAAVASCGCADRGNGVHAGWC
jgi:hypothetical protein